MTLIDLVRIVFETTRQPLTAETVAELDALVRKLEYRGRTPLVRRLLVSADIRGVSECWRWKGCKDRKGYGRILLHTAEGKQFHTRVHRVSYALFIEDPSGFQVDHECEVRDCFNPLHLKKVTLLENVHYRNHGRNNMTLEEANEMEKYLGEIA